MKTLSHTTGKLMRLTWIGMLYGAQNETYIED